MVDMNVDINGNPLDEGKHEWTVKEAGKKGGNIVKEKYGIEYYVKMGQKGGAKVASERGREFYSKIGTMGGNKVKERGLEFYSEIGTKGGNKVKERLSVDPEYYSRMGKKGGRGKAGYKKSTVVDVV